ncbi:MAG: DUF4349 domain-containing protein [Cyclobacteriaceae bacterium]|nr:DUF4349 domain-containing protein [Cyclobacteriaceae bacterium]
MTHQSIFISFVLCFILLSCSQKSNENWGEAGSIYQMDSVTANEFISSSAAVVSNDTSRKFIRTADLKFRVKNVYDESMALEDIAASFDGFVVYTHLESDIDRIDIVPMSADSSLETIFFTVRNDITVRVPNNLLDSVLRTLAIHIDYLDYRTIIAKDVTLSLSANNMAKERLEKHSKRITSAIDDKGKKLTETSKAEENLFGKQEQLDKSKLSTMSIQDQIDLSTINLHIYQRQDVKRSMIVNHKNIEAYQPGFFSQLSESLAKGWSMLKNILIGLANLWPLLLIVFGSWFLYKRFSTGKK